MEVEECKISVWVCREEKLLSGVTRRTSCADLVRVLLEDQSSPTLAGSTQSYCIVEKWRGYERVLPNRTKILRLWTAWGREQANVRFVLVRCDASLPGAGPRSAEARVVPSKESRCAEKCELATPVTAPTTETEISQEKRRRVVRKAFRKLEKIHKKKEDTCVENFGGKMETLVHLVLSQDHTIRQQTQRIRELDGEIERHEALVHTDRMRRHGTNYVQDTYLLDAGNSASAELDADLLETDCDHVIHLQEQISEQHELLERLTGELQEELDRRWMRRRRDAEDTKGDTPACQTDARLEEERIKTELDTSSYLGLHINTELEAVQSELDASRELWEEKERELSELLETLSSCDGDTGDGDAVFADYVQSPPPPPPPPSVEHSECWVERVRGLSKTNPSGNDDDSDTGLSSMHSQDSDNAAVCESLV
ncbi:Ras association domain-containing protein 10 [Bagarius yarrelli]|uniref:Ras association domain-containing protein 10 n=1 Tax=Bagarius yarrelli TaxID=175774 RepID=A0A556V2S5_BAGYA|nr:Ras association domain-containing protein 10 [Bagarius yarrelli]